MSHEHIAMTIIRCGLPMNPPQDWFTPIWGILITVAGPKHAKDIPHFLAKEEMNVSVWFA
jgi:hypothetical protein